MTLDQCYNTHKGSAVLVPGGGTGNNGQCAQWADTVLAEVYGLPYVYTPAAKDWWYKFDSFPQLKNNFDKIAKGQPIKKGDYIVYDPLSPGDPQGHIDTASRDGVINDFWAYDSNWNASAFHDKNGYPILHEVHHVDAFNTRVVGYLRKKGTSMAAAQDKIDPVSAQLLFQGLYPIRPVTAADVKFIMSFKNLEAYLRWVPTDPNHAALVAKMNAPDIKAMPLAPNSLYKTL